MSYIPDMDYQTLLYRLSQALRQARQTRGLTQAQVAHLARVPRGRVIQAEQGDPSMAMRHYAKIAAALDQEFALNAARRPTLDEIRELIEFDRV